jgi:hypothetical protein
MESYFGLEMVVHNSNGSYLRAVAFSSKSWLLQGPTRRELYLSQGDFPGTEKIP